ncbi:MULTISPECIES: hypothetical protein [unclassified Streptomyces]|uniref:hypothetical protein n=1 Tax=unclassified Streptomyces TaxID=2593676 RepID=UPI0003616587|nr:MULTISPECIES: hypothetical protein [unclassified Streptomyces]MYT30770.1 hypothetical protein [Streptomyces sp. SID8354]
MTICASEDAAALDSPHRAALTLAADGSYAARLARHDDAAGSWYPERWTIGGPEPYAVPLPGSQPEEPDSALLPLTDGRVLIVRRVADRFTVSLLSPTGPGTQEVLVGAVAAPELTLLPPAPGGKLGYALAPGAGTTALWRVHGGTAGPERIAVVPGRCTGGVWLDHEGRLLAVDRELDGRTKTVVVDLARGAEVSPLLQITEESDDRLLLADPDSGLLLVRSDAPGHDRLGWGVLDSSLPVRFPECLRAPDMAVTPFAIQPGRALLPESCAVAFRLDGPDGTRLGAWRPSERRLRQFPAPDGWLAGSGRWTPDGALLLPYATEAVRCGVARMAVPLGPAAEAELPEAAASEAALPEVAVPQVAKAVEAAEVPVPAGRGLMGGGENVLEAGDSDVDSTASPQPNARTEEPLMRSPHPRMCRPVPLQQAPLAARESQWSAVSRPVTIPAGAVQPVDPATDGTARGVLRREPGEVPTRTAVSDLTE